MNQIQHYIKLRNTQASLHHKMCGRMPQLSPGKDVGSDHLNSWPVTTSLPALIYTWWHSGEVRKVLTYCGCTETMQKTMQGIEKHSLSFLDWTEGGVQTEAERVVSLGPGRLWMWAALWQSPGNSLLHRHGKEPSPHWKGIQHHSDTSRVSGYGTFTNSASVFGMRVPCLH